MTGLSLRCDNASFRHTTPSAVTTLFYRLHFPNSRSSFSIFPAERSETSPPEVDSKYIFGLTLSAAGLTTRYYHTAVSHLLMWLYMTSRYKGRLLAMPVLRFVSCPTSIFSSYSRPLQCVPLHSLPSLYSLLHLVLSTGVPSSNV
jgi:hypothetical protein